MTTKEIRLKIENIIDESRNQTLASLNAIKHIGIDGEKNVVVLIIEIGKLGGDAERNMRRNLAKIIKLDLCFSGIKIQFEEEKKLKNDKTKYIIVESGKGGVGKSMIALNIAYALSRQNMKVGIIDADIYNSSIPTLLEMKDYSPKTDSYNKIIPFKYRNMEVISTEFFSEAYKPIIWKGALLNTMLSNFFFQVAWSKDTDYVIVDAPSGTGDVLIDLKAIIPNAEVILVTTPKVDVAHVVIKAGNAAKEMGHNIIGIIENMSYLIDNNKKSYIFGKGGADLVVDALNSELLAEIPFDVPNNHLTLYERNERNGKIFDDIATLIIIR